jgi:rod shape-determining protein MreD
MPPVWTILTRGMAMMAVACVLWMAIVLDLAPFAHGDAGWTMPDALFLCIACVTLRRPTLLPAPLVLAIGLLRDLLAGGPVGAGALGLLLAQRALLARAGALKDRTFAVEWAHVAAAAALAAALPPLLPWLTLSPGPGLGDLAPRLVMSVLAYPFVVAVLRVGRDARMRRGAMTGENA